MKKAALIAGTACMLMLSSFAAAKEKLLICPETMLKICTGDRQHRQCQCVDIKQPTNPVDIRPGERISGSPS